MVESNAVHYLVPFAVGAIPTLAWVWWVAFDLVWNSRHNTPLFDECGNERSDYERAYERATDVAWHRLAVAPFVTGAVVSVVYNAIRALVILA